MSVPARLLTGMSNRTLEISPISHQENDECQTTDSVFNDPVAYLAQFGIAAELTTETTLSIAA